jgi:hypothetical protein
MMRDEDPMTTFSDQEWRLLKQTTRRLQHRRRMEQTREADPLPWLLAVERDDRTDPVERELVFEEQPA